MTTGELDTRTLSPYVGFTDEEWNAFVQELLGDYTLEELANLAFLTKNGMVSGLAFMDYLNRQREVLSQEIWDAVEEKGLADTNYLRTGNTQAIKDIAVAKGKVKKRVIGELTKIEVKGYDAQGNPIIVYNLPGEIPIVPSPAKNRLDRYLNEIPKEKKTRIAQQLGLSNLDYLTPEQQFRAADIARPYALNAVTRNVKTEEGRQKLQDFLQDETFDIQQRQNTNEISLQEAEALTQSMQAQAYGKGSTLEKWQWEQAGVSPRRFGTQGEPLEATAQDVFAGRYFQEAQARTPIGEALKRYEASGETSGYPESVLGQLRQEQARRATAMTQEEQLAVARRFVATNPTLYAQLRAQAARGWGTGGTGATATHMISPETGGQAVATTGLGAEGAPTGVSRVAGGSYIPEFAYEQAAYGVALEDPELQAKLREAEIKKATERPAAVEAYQTFLTEKPLYTGSLETWLGTEATPLQVDYIKRQEEELRRQRKARERQAISTTAVATPQARWLTW